VGKRDDDKTMLSVAERATAQNIPGSAAEVLKISQSKACHTEAMIRYKVLWWRRSQWSTSSIELKTWSNVEMRPERRAACM